MQENEPGVRTMSPLRLLAGFSKGRIVHWIVVAAIAQAVVIGLLSVGYIRDRWVDPKGAELRKAAALEAQETLKKEAAARIARPPATPANAATATVAKAMGASTGTTEQIPAGRTNSPVVKRITEKAERGTIPAQPGDLGISIGDTDVH